MVQGNYLNVEDLEVYRKLCLLHMDVCELTDKWTGKEKYELGSQARRSSHRAPERLAEKNDDRQVRKKIEGVNHARGEAAETVLHLLTAKYKGYITGKVYMDFRKRYKECTLMLNALEKTLGRKVPEGDCRWGLVEDSADYLSGNTPFSRGWPLCTEQNLIEDPASGDVQYSKPDT